MLTYQVWKQIETAITTVNGPLLNDLFQSDPETSTAYILMNWTMLKSLQQGFIRNTIRSKDFLSSLKEMEQAEKSKLEALQNALSELNGIPEWKKIKLCALFHGSIQRKIKRKSYFEIELIKEFSQSLMRNLKWSETELEDPNVLELLTQPIRMFETKTAFIHALIKATGKPSNETITSDFELAFEAFIKARAAELGKSLSGLARITQDSSQEPGESQYHFIDLLFIQLLEKVNFQFAEDGLAHVWNKRKAFPNYKIALFIASGENPLSLEQSNLLKCKWFIALHCLSDWINERNSLKMSFLEPSIQLPELENHVEILSLFSFIPKSALAGVMEKHFYIPQWSITQFFDYLKKDSITSAEPFKLLKSDNIVVSHEVLKYTNWISYLNGLPFLVAEAGDIAKQFELNIFNIINQLGFQTYRGVRPIHNGKTAPEVDLIFWDEQNIWIIECKHFAKVYGLTELIQNVWQNIAKKAERQLLDTQSVLENNQGEFWEFAIDKEQTVQSASNKKIHLVCITPTPHGPLNHEVIKYKSYAEIMAISSPAYKSSSLNWCGLFAPEKTAEFRDYIESLPREDGREMFKEILKGTHFEMVQKILA